ncbi:MAG: 6-hydroxymethylpterin diphosphokinase MptE-like protein [Thermoplasmata archaeon]
MEYAEWAPYYRRIREALGFSLERERAAADRLLALLPERAQREPLERLARRLRGRDAVIVGLAPDVGPPPLWTLPVRDRPPVLIAADGATARCLDAGLVPEVVVTDLDGPVPSEVSANARGALVVVHAHGDNVPALEHWVPEFGGELVGSWSGPPEAGLIDVGGFTDGDRAAYLAHHFGAPRLLLWGFDFDRVEEADARALERKRTKLRLAHDLLVRLAERGPSEVIEWRPDGGTVRYGPIGPSTQ